MGTRIFGGKSLYCSDKFYTIGNGLYLDYDEQEKYTTKSMLRNIDDSDGGRAIWLSGRGKNFFIFSSGNYIEIKEIGWDD